MILLSASKILNDPRHSANGGWWEKRWMPAVEAELGAWLSENRLLNRALSIRPAQFCRVLA
jgi:hypothetical protein